MSDDLVTVATFFQPTDADLARLHLESEGIESFIVDDIVVNWLPLDSLAFGGVKLKVAAADADGAVKALQAHPLPAVSSATAHPAPLHGPGWARRTVFRPLAILILLIGAVAVLAASGAAGFTNPNLRIATGAVAIVLFIGWRLARGRAARKSSPR